MSFKATTNLESPVGLYLELSTSLDVRFEPLRENQTGKPMRYLPGTQKCATGQVNPTVPFGIQL